MTWLLLLIPMTAAAAPQLPLSPQQSIVEAHCSLLTAGGWMAASAGSAAIPR